MSEERNATQATEKRFSLFGFIGQQSLPENVGSLRRVSKIKYKIMRIVVIGGGIIAWPRRFPPTANISQCRNTVLEKRYGGLHQTGITACSCTAGCTINRVDEGPACGHRNTPNDRFCQQPGSHHEICGKLVVAANSEELPRLRDFLIVPEEWPCWAANAGHE